jgi:tetratricopeptide (TPR) repeat protein
LGFSCYDARVVSPAGSVFLLAMLAPGLVGADTQSSPDDLFTAAVREQQQGQLKSAARDYEELLKVAPDRVDALSNLGLVYGELGNYDGAIGLLNKAVRLAPSQSNIRLNLAITYLQAKRYSDAAGEARQVVSAQPSSALAHYIFGLALLKTNQLSAGIEQLEAVMNAQPGNLNAATTLASAYMKAQQIEKARMLVTGVLSRSDTADAHLMIGTYNLMTGNTRDAVIELQRAQQLNPALTQLGSTLAEANALAGNLEAAENFFRSRVRTNPGDAEANAFLGWLYLENQELDKAHEFLDKAHALRPDDAAIDFQLARLARTQGDYQHALKLLETVVAAQPKSAPAHVLLAETYLRLKRTDEAKRERELVNQINAEQRASQEVAARNR